MRKKNIRKLYRIEKLIAFSNNNINNNIEFQNKLLYACNKLKLLKLPNL